MKGFLNISKKMSDGLRDIEGMGELKTTVEVPSTRRAIGSVVLGTDVLWGDIDVGL